MSTTAVSEKFKVKDLSLADWGRKEIILAEHEMPGLMALRKKYGAEIISQHNFKARIELLRAQEQAANEGRGPQDPIGKELKEKYQAILKGEKADNEKYIEKLQEMMFDYFNMIQKEYYMSLDKWAGDKDYVTQIKDKYALIDQ